MAMAAHIPGNVLKGNFRTMTFVDDRASNEQEAALLKAFSGKLGGPLSDLANLVGEMMGVERAAITFDVQGGKGVLRIGTDAEAVMEPYRGPSGNVTTLNESIFSTIPGSPAYVAKALTYRVKNAAVGLDVDLKDHNAIQGSFRFQG
jgi:hypothetical protein